MSGAWWSGGGQCPGSAAAGQAVAQRRALVLDLVAWGKIRIDQLISARCLLDGPIGRILAMGANGMLDCTSPTAYASGGNHVVAMGRLPRRPGYMRTACEDHVTHVEADILDRTMMRRHTSSGDAIVHVGGASQPVPFV